MISRHLVTKATVILFVLISLSLGCSRQGMSNAERGAMEQVLHYANGDEPRSIDPHLTSGAPDYNVMMNLFEGLTANDPATLQPTPGVAESWQVSDDGLVYRFKLRDDAKWSNGDPVTANDFIFAWRRALTSTLPNQYAYMLYYIMGARDFYEGKVKDFSQVGVRAPDSQTLIVTLANPTHFFLQLLGHHSFYPLHQETIETYGKFDDPNNNWILPGNFVGNGPFVLSDWQINKVITLKKSGTYWDRYKVKLQTVHFYPIEDQQGEERAFRSGQIHLTNTPQMDIEKIAVYKNNHPESIRIMATYASYYYEINTKIKHLADARVRQALALAIDRELITKKVTKGGEIPAYSVIAPDPNSYIPKNYFDYDPEKAKALLAEAGYPDGRGFPGFTILYNTHDNHRKVALVIQQMLKNNLNIDVQIENKEWKVYMSARNNHEHEVARAGWLADYVDPSNFFDIFRSYSGNNRTGWASDRYDQLMTEVEMADDPGQRIELFERANSILFEEMPVIPIYYYADINLVSPAVKNWQDNVMHFHPLKNVYLDVHALVKID